MRYDLEWISRHATQSYPLTDLAYAQSSYGSQLPMSFLLDILIKVPKRYALTLKNAFYISGVSNNRSNYSIDIGCHIGDGVDFVCLRAYGIDPNITTTTSLLNRYYILIASPDSAPAMYKNIISRLTGVVYIGPIDQQHIPSIKLTYQQGAISPVCVHATSGIDAIVIGDKAIDGVILFKAGKGISIDTVQDEDTGITTITISADLSTIFLGVTSVQLAVALIKAALGRPITSINGITPNDAGQLTIAGLDCVQVNVPGDTANTVSVSNTCAKPCCGLVYSDAIKSQIEVIKLLQAVLRDYFIQQSNNINYIQASLATVIGAK